MILFVLYRQSQLHYCLLFYCCFITFYSVLPRSTLCELRFTPCYSTSCYTVLPLVSYVLLRFTLFYSVLLRAFISFHLVLLSATLFYPLRTTFFLLRFWPLTGPFSHSDLLLSCACSAVIQCLFYSHSVSVLHPFFLPFRPRISLFELAIIYI